MSKRLQVLIPPKEYKEFALIAKGCGMSLGEWVRQSLRKSARAIPMNDPMERLRRVQILASQYSAPSGSIEEINAQIESGRGLKKK